MQQLKNQLIVFCGDSTTEQGQQSNVGGLYARLINQHAISGGRLDGIAGVVNYGMSGYQLSDFANTAADDRFTGAAADDSDWDFGGNKKQGIWGGVSAADAIKIKGDIYIICFGINDLILTELGLKTQKECEEYIVRNMSIALKKIKSALPAARIILRIPCAMLPAPYLQTSFPWQAVYPDFGRDLAMDAALVAKWNQALSRAYYLLSEQDPALELLDMVQIMAAHFGPAEISADDSPCMKDLVHPNACGYEVLADAVADLLSQP